ncbi:MAG: hypoxanthine phosphoribosyltransferase [Chlorobi bacterium]|nr:hypoxanthine phosphoribosyltransferase [Chlorobiota bacterium]
MNKVKVLDKEFVVSITKDKIQDAVRKMADKMNADLKGKDIIFMGILNGSFMFAADLFRQIKLDCRITFLKLASYQGTTSSGNVKRLIGLHEDIKGKTVIVLEDIVDTGITLDNIKKQLIGYEPEEIKIATFLFKPDAYQKDIPIDYVGIEIPNDFIIGYGLDYDGFGRNLEEIYTLAV